MSKGNLKAKKRKLKEQKKGLIPAVLYGKNVDNQILWIDQKEFSKAYQLAKGSTLVDMFIEGDKEKRAVLIYDVQVHPVTGDFVHIDFFQVDMKQEIETDIQLVFTGIAPAVKELGGTFVKSIDKLPVKCLPGDLVTDIEVDISSIKDFDNYIYVKDLKIPKGIKVTIEDDVVIALATAPRTAAEMEKLDEEIDADISKVEGMEESTDAEDGSDNDNDKSENAGEKKEEKKEEADKKE